LTCIGQTTNDLGLTVRGLDSQIMEFDTCGFDHFAKNES